MNWSAFRDQGVFLYRRVGDRGEAWIGAGVRSFHRESEPKATGAFQRIKEFVRGSDDWVFAMLGYDLKNATESLTTRLAGVMELPLAYLFVPRFVVKLSDDEAILMVHHEDRGEGEAWLGRLLEAPQLLPSAKLEGWEMGTSRATYLDRCTGSRGKWSSATCSFGISTACAVIMGCGIGSGRYASLFAFLRTAQSIHSIRNTFPVPGVAT